MTNPKKITIKRYGNRRLYNSETRSYVKLIDIANLIRGGAEIQVLDSRTGEDITKLVLTQIILEEEKSKKDLLPLNFLYELIRHQQGWVHEFFQRHVVKPLETVLPSKGGELLSNLRQSLDLRAASAGLIERLLHRGANPESKPEEPGSALEGKPQESEPLPPQPLEIEEAPLQEEPAANLPTEELVHRFAEMELRLRKLESLLTENH